MKVDPWGEGGARGRKTHHPSAHVAWGKDLSVIPNLAISLSLPPLSQVAKRLPGACKAARGNYFCNKRLHGSCMVMSSFLRPRAVQSVNILSQCLASRRPPLNKLCELGKEDQQ